MMMKKSICIILTVVLLFSCIVPAFAAQKSLPVVFVPGYTSSQMYINRGTENEKKVWKVEVADELLDALKQEIPELIKNSGKALVGDYTDLFRVLEPYANEITDYLRINDDSTSKYAVEVYPQRVEDTRLDRLDALHYHPDNDTLNLLKRYTDRKNIYCCILDWRLGQVDNAKVLNDYINDLLQITGAEKVNIIGVSYGGQVAASYLSLYGGSKVHNVVLHSPALDGSAIVPQLLGSEDIAIAWTDLLKLALTFSYSEADYSEITELINPDFLDNLIQEFVRYYLADLFVNFGSAWDLVPTQSYESLRDSLINDGKHTELVRKSDLYHYQIAANRRQDFQRLQQEGVHLAIISGCGYQLAVANQMNSDGVIQTASTTGAVCAPIGKTLGKDYKASECSCADHYHISPNHTIDATTGYLPENTWFVQDMFHGLGTNEQVVGELIGELLFTDTISDVHSNPKYPQFMSSDNAFLGVLCSFSNCVQSYITPYSTELCIQNLSRESNIMLADICVKGAKLCFDDYKDIVLLPGQQIQIAVYGELPEKDLSSVIISVDYVVLKEDYRIAKNRTQYFTYTNGLCLHEVNTVTDENAPTIEPKKDSSCKLYGKEAFLNRLVLTLRRLYDNLVTVRKAFTKVKTQVYAMTDNL